VPTDTNTSLFELHLLESGISGNNLTFLTHTRNNTFELHLLESGISGRVLERKGEEVDRLNSTYWNLVFQASEMPRPPDWI